MDTGIILSIKGFQKNTGENKIQNIDLDRPIIPYPQTIKYFKELILINTSLSITLYVDSEDQEFSHFDRNRLNFHIKDSLTFRKDFGLEINYVSGNKNELMIKNLHTEFTDYIYNFNLNDEQSNQSYLLKIDSEEIILIGYTEKAIYYGLTTLSQMIHEYQGTISGVWCIQKAITFDFPTFTLRGIADHQSHDKVSTVESMKRLIKFVSRYKNNMLGINFADSDIFNEGDESENIKKTNTEWGVYTTEDIVEMIECGKQYYIEIVPGFKWSSYKENVLIHFEYQNITQLFPDISYAQKYILKMANNGKKYGAQGFINSSWRDFTNETLRINNIYIYALGSFCAWNHKVYSEERFYLSFFYDYFGMQNGHLLWDTLQHLNKINRGGPWKIPFLNRLRGHNNFSNESKNPIKHAKADLKKMNIVEEMLGVVVKTIHTNKNAHIDSLKYIIDLVKNNSEKALLT